MSAVNVTKVMFDSRFANNSTLIEAYDWYDYTAARFTLQNGDDEIEVGESGAVDYLYFYGDLRGCTLELTVDFATVASVTSTGLQAHFIQFPSDAGIPRWVVTNNSGGTQTVEIRHIMAGEALAIPGQQPGFNAPALSEDVELITNLSETGQFLGRSIKRRASVFTIDGRLLSITDAHAGWLDFIQHAQCKPFVFYQDIGDREDIVWCWADKQIRPASYSSPIHIDQSITVRGRVV